MKKSLSRIRSFASSITEWTRQNEPRHTPDLRDQCFFIGLLNSQPELRQAKSCFESGDTGRARRLIVDYFRGRRTPRFFVDPSAVPRLIAEIEVKHPEWMAATVEASRLDLEKGLNIYSRRGLVLNGSQTWRTLAQNFDNDILYAVRPHRFGFAPRLALASLHGAPTLRILNDLVTGWAALAATGDDPLPYISNLVAIQRILALSWTWAFVAAHPRDETDARADLEFALLKIIHADARFLSSRLGDSFANNHRLADGFAGWYLGTLFPEFSGSAEWLQRGESIWLEELRRQIYDDGTSFEHSLHYHEFGCELAIAYVLLRRRNGAEPPAWVLERVNRMLEFQAVIGGPEAMPFPLGDTTEDPLFPLDAGHGWGTGAMRELYRALSDSDISPTGADDPTIERAFWMLGGAVSGRSKRKQAKAAFQAYPDGGFYTFPEDDGSTRLVIRTGPTPGRLLTAGHMHADLLSIYLSLASVPVIVEAGTYTYRFGSKNSPPGTPNWRAYFVGPEAHNGLVIRGNDPLGPITGDFRDRDVPVRVATDIVRDEGNISWVEGRVCGESPYGGHRRGVVHIRGAYWLIYDWLPPGTAGGEASLGLQFSSQAEVAKVSARGAHVEFSGTSLWVVGNEALSVGELVSGRTNPPGGWVSPGYGELVAAPHLRFDMVDVVSPAAFILLAGSRVDPAKSVESLVQDGVGFGFRVSSGDFVDYFLVRQGSVPGTIEGWGMQFDGALAWVRTDRGTPLTVRWVNGQTLSWPEKHLEIRSPLRATGLDIQLTASGPEVHIGAAEDIHIDWPWESYR